VRNGILGILVGGFVAIIAAIVCRGQPSLACDVATTLLEWIHKPEGFVSSAVLKNLGRLLGVRTIGPEATVYPEGIADPLLRFTRWALLLSYWFLLGVLLGSIVRRLRTVKRS